MQHLLQARLTICIDQTRRALVIVLPCYGALEIVGVIIIIIIKATLQNITEKLQSKHHKLTDNSLTSKPELSNKSNNRTQSDINLTIFGV